MGKTQLKREFRVAKNEYLEAKFDSERVKQELNSLADKRVGRLIGEGVRARDAVAKAHMEFQSKKKELQEHLNRKREKTALMARLLRDSLQKDLAGIEQNLDIENGQTLGDALAELESADIDELPPASVSEE